MYLIIEKKNIYLAKIIKLESESGALIAYLCYSKNK